MRRYNRQRIEASHPDAFRPSSRVSKKKYKMGFEHQQETWQQTIKIDSINKELNETLQQG